MPEHLRRGLVRALLIEGLCRLQRMGATRAFVGGYDKPANGLYASVFDPVPDRSEQWVKKGSK